MPVAATGPLTFGTLADNNNSGSKSNLRIASLSDTYASGSSVGDVNNDGTINDTDRNLLKAAPHLLSEFRGAEATNVFFGPITPQLASDASSVTGNGYVDEEAAQITFFVTDDAKGNQYKVGLKDASSNAILVSNTDTVSGGDGANRTITFTAPATTEASDKYYAFVESTSDPFANVNNTSQLLDHFDRLTGGSTSITNSGQSISTAGESVSNVVLTPTVSAGTQNSTSITTTVLEAGDGGTISATNTSGTTFSLSNTPGQIRFNVTHIGSPSQARNSTTSTATATVSYTRAIDDVASLDTSNSSKTQFNSGDTIRIRAVSEGITSSTNIKIGFSTSDSNTAYSNTPTERTITTSQFVRDTELVDTSHTLTSGTSLATFFPKANYTSGTANTTAGSSFSVAPAFSYSKTGNQTINVNQTQAFSVSSVVGHNASVSITSEDSIGSGTNSATMSPGANNKVYTITFTGTASFSQTNNQTSTLTVNPTVSVGVSPGSGTFRPTTDTHGDAIASSTHGITPTEFTFTPSVVGNNITSFSYSITNFSFTSGNSSTQGTVKGKYTSGGSKSSDLTVSGTDSTSATTSFDQTITAVTKAFTGGVLDGALREGSNITLSGVSANFVQNMRVQRHNGSSFVNISNITSDISGNVSVSGTANLERDTNSSREVRIIDTDSSATIVRSLGNAAILGPLPVIDTFSAATGNILGEIDLTIATTNATAASVNQGVGSVSVDSSVADTGNSNNTSITYTLTATNADGESVTATASATTINPSLTIPNNPSLTSWTKGDTGNFTIAYTKNFDDTVPLEMGEGLTTGGGGTVYQSINVTAQSGTITFDRNQMHGTTFGTIVDFRIGNATSGRVVRDNTATFSDFSAPGAPSNNNSSAASATSIIVAFNAGSNATRHKIYDVTGGGETLKATVSMPTTSATITGYSTGQTRTFRVDAERDVTTTPNGSSTTTTKTTQSSTFSVTTQTFSSIFVAGSSMSSTSGVGFSTVQETAVLSTISSTQELFYRSDLVTPGSNTVTFFRSINGSVWSGDGSKFFRMGTTHIGIIDGSGEMDANQYIANTQAIPIAPTGWAESDTGASNIEMEWTDNSGIEDEFEIYRNVGSSADNNDTLAGTVPANNTEFDDTGLSNNSAPTISAFGGGSSDSVIISGQSVNRILFTASGIDSYTLKFNTSGHSSAYSSTAIANTSSGISGGSISQLLLHSGLTGGTTYYYQITAIKAGKTYYYAVYAKNGNTLSTSAATGNASLSNVTSTSTATQLAVSNTSISGPADYDQTAADGNVNTSGNKTFNITSASGNTTITFVKVSGTTQVNPQFAVTNDGSTPTSFQNSGTTSTKSASSSIIVKTRFTGDSSLAGQTGVYRITVTNNSVSDTVDVSLVTFDEGGFGGP